MAPREVRIPVGDARVEGTLEPAGNGSALAIFAHGTLLFDLLPPEEEAIDRVTARLRFDVAMLAARLEAAAQWAIAHLFEEPGTLDQVAELATGWFQQHLPGWHDTRRYTEARRQCTR